MMINKQLAESYKWGNDCDSWIFCNSKNLSIKLESMPANSSENKHLHTQKEQFFFVLQGTASFFLEGKFSKLKKSEGIFVEANKPHFIQNESQEPLDFLVITSPNIESDRMDLPLEV